MNAAHLHLLLNHFPTIGFCLGLGLLIFALFGRSDELKRASLVILFLTAAMSITTYVSGSDAQMALKDDPKFSAAAISAHETAALVAFALMQVAGFFAWFGLWMFRQAQRFADWNLAIVLILSIGSLGLMARAVNIGGEIRHPEIQSEQKDTAADPEATMARTWGKYVEANSFVWPTLETLHFVGLSMLIGVVLTLDLRMLGVGKSFSFAAVYQLLPVGMLGFAINLISGALFFVATPKQYVGFLFFLKMILVVVGALNVLYFIVLDEPWTVDEGVDAPIRAKVVAASAIFIWLGVLFCGHMLPFLGNSF